MSDFFRRLPATGFLARAIGRPVPIALLITTGVLVVGGLLLAIVPLLVPSPADGAPAPVYGYEVVRDFPHDPGAFTQGLIYKDGFFYEGTGEYGASSLRKVEIETGEVLMQWDLPGEFFGEGITALRDTIYQLTWIEQTGFSYVEQDSSFALLEAFVYPWEGWGLTDDGTHLIASDGSSTIRFLDPRTRELVREIQVHDDGAPVIRLNELEYILGRIYANIWYSDRIAIIDPSSGRVDAWLDLTGLRDGLQGAQVLNGIAFDPQNLRLFVTGKRWPRLFEIRVPPLDPSTVEPDVGQGRVGQGLDLRATPNPASGPVRFSFRLARESDVSLDLFGPGGRLVTTVAQGPRGAGEHAFTLDTGGLHPGAYWLRLVSGEDMRSRKIVVVR